MWISLLALFFFAFMLLFLIAAISTRMVESENSYDSYTEVTTTTEQESYLIVGRLHRLWENGQPYVTDPVDNDKVWLNTKDDLYEDAGGKIWELL